MPMAGLGKRFSESNYNLPKPLILIKNKPMFIQAEKYAQIIIKYIYVTKD